MLTGRVDPVCLGVLQLGCVSASSLFFEIRSDVDRCNSLLSVPFRTSGRQLVCFVDPNLRAEQMCSDRLLVFGPCLVSPVYRRSVLDPDDLVMLRR